MTRDAPILEAKEVRKTYPGGEVALDDVDLEVGAGQTVALIGESGSGKTTLLRLFNRMVEPTAGAVCFYGDPVDEMAAIALRRQIGYVPQHGGLIPHWTTGRNVELVPRLLKWREDRSASRAAEILDLVGLDPQRFRDRYPNQLSGGQRQRVAIARALAADPPVILLDEPFGALDAMTRLELRREFVRLQKTTAKTALLVTHDLEEALELADRIAVMRSGRILQTAAPSKLLDSPADDYVAGLLSQATDRRSTSTEGRSG